MSGIISSAGELQPAIKVVPDFISGLAASFHTSGLFSTTLSNEYYLAAATFGLDQRDVLRLATSAIKFVFGGSEVKKTLRGIFQNSARKLVDVFPSSKSLGGKDERLHAKSLH